MYRWLLLGWFAISLQFAGCGASVSSDIKTFGRTRSADELENPPATPAENPPPASALAAVPAIAAAPAPVVQSPVASPLPAASAAKPAVAVREEDPRIIIRNVKPDEPLTAAEQNERTLRNLRKIGQALEAHLKMHQTLPPAATMDAAGKPLLSWRVALLPLLGYAELHEQFRLNEPWDSPYNHQLVAQIPPEFQAPQRFDDHTCYLALVGRGLAFSGTRGMTLENFEDGAARTVILVEVESEAAVPWTQPAEHQPQPATAKRRLGGVRKDGFYCLLGTGEPRFISNQSADRDVWALFTIEDPDVTQSALLALQEPSLPAAVTAGLGPVASSAAPGTVPQTSELPNTELPTRGTIDDALAALNLLPPYTPDRNRIPAPSHEEQKLAKAQLRELYQKDIEGAKTPAARLTLAKKLVTDAGKLEAEPTTQFVLLQVAKDLAIKSGDAGVAIRTVEKLEGRFDVDLNEARFKVLEEVHAWSIRTPAQNTLLATEADKLLSIAVERQDFDLALKLQTLLTEAARRTGDKALVNRLANSKADVEGLKMEFKEVPAAVDKLRSEPGDPLANQIVGRYLCLVRNCWREGLPLLAKSQDVRLRVVASVELETGKSPQAMIELADQWWEMGQKARSPAKRSLQMRATYWYAQAIALDARGVDRLRAEKRLSEANTLFGADAVAKVRALFEKTPTPKVAEEAG